MKFQIRASIKLMMWLIALSFLLLSCAPKKQGVRVTSKKAQVQLTPGTSATADQQGASLNANYKVFSVGFPTDNGSTVVVQSELQDPSNQYLPISTTHDSVSLDSEGVYTDTSRGLQIYVNARCSADNCNRYYLLVTAVRNNVAVYQNGAVSFKEDCSFYTISIGSTANMYNSLDAFVSRWAHLTPIGDSAACFE